MNVIYMHTHDSGRFLDPPNAGVPLPGIERLAATGVSFRNAFAAAPTCSPSRSALLTGSYPHENGMVGLAHRGFRLRDYSRHLNRLMRRGGLETVLCGVQHVAPDKGELGYDRILDDAEDYFASPPETQEGWDMENADRVAAYLAERGGDRRSFFLSYGMLTTHRPFPEGEGAAWQEPSPPAPVANRRESRKDMDRFYRGLGIVDRNVAIVLDALDRAGLAEETAVILTTDHGIPFPRMKGTLRDDGIGVSLLLRIPGVTGVGAVEDALVSQIDLYPTLCELLGLPVPEETDGRSLLPLLRGEVRQVRRTLFAETNYHAVYEPARAVRSERYKLIRRYGDSLRRAPANVDDSPSKELLAAAGYFRLPEAREEFYDLFLDPGEGRNLRGESEYAAVYEEHAALLDGWMNATADPLLRGTVPLPRGARLNDRDAYSAEEPTYSEET